MSAPASRSIIPLPRITGRRATPRVRLYVPAKVQLLSRQENCLLDDLSQVGARVTIAAKLPSCGASVVLTSKGLDVFGTVIWSLGARFAILFEEPLPLDQVIRVRHLADAGSEHEITLKRRSARLILQGRSWLKDFS